MPASSGILRQRIFLQYVVGVMIAILLGMDRASVSYAIGPSSFSIEPSFFGSHAAAPRAYFTFDSFPGASTYDSIYVTNDSSVRGTVGLYAVDAITGQTTGTSVRPRNDPQVDVGAWITLSRQQVTLDPGQSQEIPFTLTIPFHVRPGQHGGVIMAEDMRQQHFARSTHGSDVKIGMQAFIGLGVLVNLPGPKVEHLDATSIRYDQGSAKQRVLIALSNTGTQLLHPSGSLQVTDEQGHVLQNIPLIMNTFLPQTSIDYPVYIQNKALALGKSYRATLHLTYEDHHVLNYVTSFYVALPKKELVTNLVQHLVAPPSGNIFSILTPWDYVIGLSTLFLLLSALFFWGQKIYGAIRRMSHKK